MFVTLSVYNFKYRNSKFKHRTQRGQQIYYVYIFIGWYDNRRRAAEKNITEMESDMAHELKEKTGNEQKRNKIQFYKLKLKVEEQTEEKRESILKLNL